MAQIINTNIASLNAQRNLTTSQNSLNTSLQRLSSGLRINSAKDDAAGLAIATRMSSQIRGLTQASRNASDGISLAQTAEGALGEVSANLLRMRELAVQSANGTNSTSDRAALQSEVDQLKNEIDRVANQTSFNGTKLLDGSTNGFSFQVGADANQTIAITSLGDSRADKLGSSTYATFSGDVIDLTGGGTAPDLSALEGDVANTSLAVGGFELNGVTITGSDMSVGDNAAVTQAEYKSYMSKTVDAINAKSSESGVSAELVYDSTTGEASINLFSTEDIEFTAGTANLGTLIGIDGATGTGGAANGEAIANVGFESIDITSIAGANKALTMLDGAINAVNTMRGDLGAVQNRFESTISNLATSTENLSAARSRIQDADYAIETANLSRTQILQQAGTAMLAQAKALPQNVLSLLQ